MSIRIPTKNVLFESTDTDKEQAIEKIINSSSPRKTFFFMLAAAVIIATAGLALDNVAVVIGAVLVAPMLSPLLSLSLGIVMSDFKVIARSAKVIVQAIALTLLIAFVISWLIEFSPLANRMIAQLQPSLAYFYIALAAGFAASLAVVRPDLSEYVPGTIIAVALVPPLSGIAIGLRAWQLPIAVDALELFILNLVGIVLASVVVFSLIGFYEQRQDVNRAISREEKVLEEEKEGKKSKSKKK